MTIWNSEGNMLVSKSKPGPTGYHSRSDAAEGYPTDGASYDHLIYMVSFGRKTGQKHVVKLRFVTWDRNSVCILIDRSKSNDWLKNLLASLTGNCIVRSNHLYARIISVEPFFEQKNDAITAKQMAIQRFESKYGKFISDETSLVPVVIHYEKLQSNFDPVEELEFDIQATNYTSQILSNRVSRWMREMTVDSLLRTFKTGQTVLEIGAGSGIETVELAKKGVRVIATDVSTGMLAHLQERAQHAEVESRINTIQLSSNEISKLREFQSFPREGVDGAFSTFGAMNLEPNLAKFAEDLRRLMKTRAFAVFAVWNRFCLSDILAQTLKGDLSLTRKRLSGVVHASGDSPYSLDTFTYSPREFSSYFEPHFEVDNLFALPAFIIPYWYNRWSNFLLRFANADRALGKLPLLSSTGDNFVVTLRSKKVENRNEHRDTSNLS